MSIEWGRKCPGGLEADNNDPQFKQFIRHDLYTNPFWSTLWGRIDGQDTTYPEHQTKATTLILFSGTAQKELADLSNYSRLDCHIICVDSDTAALESIDDRIKLRNKKLGFTFYEEDITKKGIVERLIADHNPDNIVISNGLCYLDDDHFVRVGMECINSGAVCFFADPTTNHPYYEQFNLQKVPFEQCRSQVNFLYFLQIGIEKTSYPKIRRGHLDSRSVYLTPDRPTQGLLLRDGTNAYIRDVDTVMTLLGLYGCGVIDNRVSYIGRQNDSAYINYRIGDVVGFIWEAVINYGKPYLKANVPLSLSGYLP